MTETVSETDENLILLQGPAAFAKHADLLVEGSRRKVFILSTELDFPLFHREAFTDRVSALARGDRNAQVNILVKEIRPLLEQGHLLLKLARRLPSKIRIRKLVLEPQDATMAYVIGDEDRLLYKHDDRDYDGFVNYRAPLECKERLTEFTYLWEQHGLDDPGLRELKI